MYQRMVGMSKSVLLNFRFLKKIGHKPPHKKERHDDHDNESTAQCFQLMMTIPDFNVVTKINNTTYWKAVMTGIDKQEIL
jgi:hypothetical protein